MIKTQAHTSLLRRLWSLCRRPRRALLADDRGATAVEFALLAFPFFGLIAAIMQTAVVFLASQVLESAVNDAARLIRTGQLQSSGATIDTFRTAVCDNLLGLYSDCEGLHIRVVSDELFGSVGVVVPVDLSCTTVCDWTEDEVFTPGAGEKVVLAQVFYRYPVVIQLGPFGMANLGDGTRLLGASAVFLNEPFGE